MQQFEASAFNAVVRWHELSAEDTECTSHNFILLAICMPKIIEFSRDLTKFWQKSSHFFGTQYMYTVFDKRDPFCFFS